MAQQQYYYMKYVLEIAVYDTNPRGNVLIKTTKQILQTIHSTYYIKIYLKAENFNLLLAFLYYPDLQMESTNVETFCTCVTSEC